MASANSYTETKTVQTKEIVVNLQLSADEAQAVSGLLGPMRGDTDALDAVYFALHDALNRIDVPAFWNNPHRRQAFDAPPLY